ncbi:MAG: hypothetical protein HKL99_14225 [Burkholderiales bacterium]|nr:hypothetical protein [Burkholderiales bacterium]
MANIVSAAVGIFALQATRRQPKAEGGEDVKTGGVAPASVMEYLAARASLQRKTTATLRTARDLAGAFAAVAASPNAQEILREALLIGEDVGAACAGDLALRGGVPSWMSTEALRGQIASLMWPIASMALQRGDGGVALRESLRETFITLVTSLPEQQEPEFARLPQGIAVAMTEQRKMAEHVLPPLLQIVHDRNARFYLTDTVAASTRAIQAIREAALEFTATLVDTAPAAAEQRAVTYQSMFGTAAVLMEHALRRAHAQTFGWVRKEKEAGARVSVMRSRETFAHLVEQHFAGGCDLLRQTMAAAEATRPSLEAPSKPELAS